MTDMMLDIGEYEWYPVASLVHVYAFKDGKLITVGYEEGRYPLTEGFVKKYERVMEEFDEVQQVLQDSMFKVHEEEEK